MKEIIAIIRPGKDRQTKEALAKIGCLALTSLRVRGRGKQRGLKYSALSADASVPQFVIMKYLPKKLLYLVVSDNLVKTTLQAIIRANQTGQYGDGKIFVMPIEEATRVRTGEKGEVAIR